MLQCGPRQGVDPTAVTSCYGADKRRAVRHARIDRSTAGTPNTQDSRDLDGDRSPPAECPEDVGESRASFRQRIELHPVGVHNRRAVER